MRMTFRSKNATRELAEICLLTVKSATFILLVTRLAGVLLARLVLVPIVSASLLCVFAAVAG